MPLPDWLPSIMFSFSIFSKQKRELKKKKKKYPTEAPIIMAYCTMYLFPTMCNILLYSGIVYTQNTYICMRYVRLLLNIVENQATVLYDSNEWTAKSRQPTNEWQKDNEERDNRSNCCWRAVNNFGFWVLHDDHVFRKFR